VFAVLIISAFILAAVFYNTTDSFDAKVYSVNVQQNMQGSENGFSTSYSYIVGTSRGTYEISPEGLFHSNSFGVLEIDSTYHFFTRGVSIPIIGVYPYIIEARLVKENVLTHE
jgi:hypothetical protein